MYDECLSSFIVNVISKNGLDQTNPIFFVWEMYVFVVNITIISFYHNEPHSKAQEVLDFATSLVYVVYLKFVSDVITNLGVSKPTRIYENIC